jgi:hypothetical protein
MLAVQGEFVSCWVYYMLHAIFQIRFSVAYSALTNPEKTTHFEFMLKHHNPEADDKARKQFKGIHTSLVTTRNDMYLLYRNVIIFILFFIF